MNIRVWRRPAADDSISKPLLTVTKLKGDARSVATSLKPTTDLEVPKKEKERPKFPETNTTVVHKMCHGDYAKIGDHIIVEVEKRFGKQTRIVFSLPKDMAIEFHS